jgi:hypothetical protein
MAGRLKPACDLAALTAAVPRIRVIVVATGTAAARSFLYRAPLRLIRPKQESASF